MTQEQAAIGAVESLCQEVGQQLSLRVDGRALTVYEGTLVAAALAIADPRRGARVAPGGARRLPFCGMGVCGECRVTIDGRPHRLGCQVLCADGMEIRSDD